MRDSSCIGLKEQSLRSGQPAAGITVFDLLWYSREQHPQIGIAVSLGIPFEGLENLRPQSELTGSCFELAVQQQVLYRGCIA